MQKAKKKQKRFNNKINEIMKELQLNNTDEDSMVPIENIIKVINL